MITVSFISFLFILCLAFHVLSQSDLNVHWPLQSVFHQYSQLITHSWSVKFVDFKRVPCVWYVIQFKILTRFVKVLINICFLRIIVVSAETLETWIKTWLRWTFWILKSLLQCYARCNKMLVRCYNFSQSFLF